MYIFFYEGIPSKKNSKQITFSRGRVFLKSSDEHNLWHRHFANWLLDSSTYSENWETLFWKENLKMSVLFFKTKKNKRFDMTNAIQSIEDLLTDTNYISDDNKKIIPQQYNCYLDKQMEDDLFCFFVLDENKIFLKEELIAKIDELYKINWWTFKNQNLYDYYNAEKESLKILKKNKAKARKQRKEEWLLYEALQKNNKIN